MIHHTQIRLLIRGFGMNISARVNIRLKFGLICFIERSFRFFVGIAKSTRTHR